MNLEERYWLFTSAISSLCRYVQTLRGMALKYFGIRGSNANCLFFLSSSEEGLTVSELSGLCGQDKAAVSRSLSELEEAGMVQIRLENGKRYRGRFFLTQRGIEVSRNLLRKIHSCVLAGGELLSEEEREIFYRCLKKILGSLEMLLSSSGQEPG